MLTKPAKVNVMGTEIRVEFRKEADDPLLVECAGYYDATANLIVVKNHAEEYTVKDPEAVQRKTLRHEIIHAFLHESGLDWSSNPVDSWATNEEMVDWFAIQAPKIFKAFGEVGAL